MIKIRCEMARIQNEEEASKELNFRTLTLDGEVRNPTHQKRAKWPKNKATSISCTNIPEKKLT